MISMVYATYQMSLSVKEIIALDDYLGSSCPKHRFLAFNRLEVAAGNSVICGLQTYA